MTPVQDELQTLHASLERETRAWREAMDRARRTQAIEPMLKAFNAADIHQTALINLTSRIRRLARQSQIHP